MTSGLEFEGKNVEDAVRNACGKLGVKEEKLEYDVVSYGSTGIFGLVGVKKARIRVTSPKARGKSGRNGRVAASEKSAAALMEEDRREIKSIVEESFGDLERRHRPKAAREDSGEEGAEKVNGPGDERKEKTRREEDGGKKEKRKEEVSEKKAPEKEAPEKKKREKEEREKEEREKEASDKGAPEKAPAERLPPEENRRSEDDDESAAREVSDGESEKDVGEEPPGPDPVQVGREAIGRIVEAIAEGASIEAGMEGRTLNIDVKGGNPAVLIGKKGQTLEAMQYLVEKVVNKRCRKRTRVSVDVEGYLETRRKNLEKLSARLAEKAARIGKPVTIGHMNPNDRRIVHMFLKEDAKIRTQSVGDGFYRKLVIFPKKGKKAKGGKSK